MKTISYRILTRFMALVLTSSMLMSYTPHRGGEGFEVFLNNKLVVQLFGKKMNGTGTLYLEPGVNNEISIRYYHCGQTGKSRRIDIKNEKGEIVKTWRFADNASPGNAMKFKINEAPGLKLLAGQVRWSIHYTSSELPDGRQLALLANSSAATARR